ncbi:hypothetical protein Tco_1140474 [Tanacetum coccineum]
MELCTKLQQRVLDLENSKTSQDSEVAKLKRRVKKLEKKKRSRTPVLKRIYRVGSSRRVESSEEEDLGDQEDASKQGRKIDDIDKDVEITLVDETQGRYGDDLMFDTCVLDDVEVVKTAEEIRSVVEEVTTIIEKAKLVSAAEETINAAATTASTILVSDATTTTTTIITDDEITLAKALAELKSAKPSTQSIAFREPVKTTEETRSVVEEVTAIIEKAKLVSTAEEIVNAVAITAITASTIPVSVATNTTVITDDEITLAKALAELKSAKPSTQSIAFREPVKSTTTTISSKDKERLAREKDEANVAEEDRLVRQREEEANIVSWDNMQAMIDADYQMAQQMQTEEQDKLSIEEKSKLFQLLEARKKHFAVVRAKEMRNKPPTKARKRNTVSTYVKNMDGYKHNQLKNKSFDDIQKLFDNSMKRVNTFVDMNTELVEGSKKRAGEELMQESVKKQNVDDDKEIVELKSLIEVVPDKEEVAINAIPLATKPPSIIDWKIYKEGQKSYYQITRANGSSKMYLVFSQLLKSFDREDLGTLWRLVKAKYGYTMLEVSYERVLWGDLKVMFEPHIEDAMWRNLQGSKVLVWKLFDSRRVHFVMFQNLHIYMLVEKKYPLTAPTIIDMLNRKLQADHWNEMCYQLLKLITK